MSFTDVFTNHKQVCFEEIKKVLRKNNNEVNLRDFIVVTINCGDDYVQNVYISKVVLENDEIFCCEQIDYDDYDDENFNDDDFNDDDYNDDDNNYPIPNKYHITDLVYLEDVGELTDYLVNL